MTEQQLNDRKDLLQLVISVTRGKGYFSLGQRICLHQEVGAVLEALESIKEGELTSCQPRYGIPEHLEKTVNRVIRDFEVIAPKEV